MKAEFKFINSSLQQSKSKSKKANITISLLLVQLSTLFLCLTLGKFKVL